MTKNITIPTLPGQKYTFDEQKKKYHPKLQNQKNPITKGPVLSLELKSHPKKILANQKKKLAITKTI